MDITMTENEQIANIIAFLAIMVGEEASEVIMALNPKYVIEKFNRYILSENPEYEWGMHPNLKAFVFDRYMKKWGINLND